MAYVRIDELAGYVERHYGRPPRLRGIRLMRVERERKNDRMVVCDAD